MRGGISATHAYFYYIADISILPAAMSNKDQIRISKLETWIEERKKDRDYGAKQFDKLIVYISGGGLAITTGITSYSPDLKCSDNYSLAIASWILFTAALILNIISQITSQWAQEFEIIRTEQEIAQLEDESGNTPPPKKRTDRWRLFFDRVTFSFNYISLLSLMAAIVLYTIFITK